MTPVNTVSTPSALFVPPLSVAAAGEATEHATRNARNVLPTPRDTSRTKF